MHYGIARGLICVSVYAQRPSIAPGGVVSAASYTQPITPGSIVAIFGRNLATEVLSAGTTPLPTHLGDTSVSIGGIAAPLFYVSPTQINAQVPSSLAGALPAADSYATEDVIVTTSFGASAAVGTTLFVEAPGVFTADGSGCGPAAALNVAPDGSLSPNTPSNSAAPGDFVVLFGTGFDPVRDPPPDGSPSAASPLEYNGGFIMGGQNGYPLQYFGLAPGLVGVDQANLQIPIGAPQGCAVPIAIDGGLFNMTSPTVSISVHSSRGQCVDPPTQAYGSVALVKTVSTGTSDDGEADTLTATFPFGPQLTRPVDSQTPENGYVVSTRLPAPGRSCPVLGYGHLSAGDISVNGPSGQGTAGPISVAGSIAYSETLPPGFLSAGSYAISADGGSNVGPFQASVTVDSPIQIKAVTPGSDVAPGTPYTVTWSGGSANDVVKLTLVYQHWIYDEFDYGYAPASAGSISFYPFCSGNPVSAGGNGVVCGFGLTDVTEIVVEQIPASAQIPTVLAAGLTGGVRVLWSYRYVFGPNGTVLR